MQTVSKRPFRIQYISDIHLEMYDKLAFPLILKPNARYLALCGDIGHPRQPIFRSFMDYCSQRWDKVFYVPGNHDYYNKRPKKDWKYSTPESMDTIDATIRSILAPYRNVHFLNNNVFEFPEHGINILGTPLWTDIPYDKFEAATERLRDMNYISVRDSSSGAGSSGAGSSVAGSSVAGQFTPEVMKALHAKCSTWLLDALWQTNAQGRKAVVLTHHMPSEVLVAPKYKGDPHWYIFYTEMSTHLSNPALLAWICGHSHSCERVMYRPGVWLLMNARGYPDERTEGFNEGAVFEDKGSKDALFNSEEVELM